MNTYRYYIKSSENMSEVEDKSVRLVVFSPPYNVGLEYESIPYTVLEYMALISNVAKEIKRILMYDGRFAIVYVPYTFHKKTKQMFPLEHCIMSALEANGLTARYRIIWNKGHITDNGFTAWGSYMSASSPHIRCMTENILIGYTDSWRFITKGISTMSDEQFQTSTTDLWNVQPEINIPEHPAPFPVELAEKLINLLTYQGDLVVDPFLGSGTTIVACQNLQRSCVGYELNPTYEHLIKKRTRIGLPNVNEIMQKIKQE